MDFLNNHPYISLFALAIIVEGLVRIIGLLMNVQR